MWQKIANQINEKAGTSYTAQQCDTKFKLLTSTYKQIIKENNTSGKETRHWEYYDLMDEILYKKPEITSETTCSNRRGLIVNNDNLYLFTWKM